jgi:hypothetical protein
MIELVKIARVEPLGGFRLRISFTSGDAGDWDFSPMIGEGGTMVAPLQDPTFFARAFVQNGVLAWPNGFDIDAIALHEEMRAAKAVSKLASAAS